MGQFQFFAMREDLLPLLEKVESKGPLRYMRMDRYMEPKFEVFVRGSDIPNLGIANCESAIGCDQYLVYEPDVLIKPEVVNESSGIQSYRINQLNNPNTITFSPGGLWKGEIALYGRAVTVSASYSESAKRLLRRFQAAIRKSFVKIKAYYVAPNALELLKAGKRFTIAEQSPREFDLTLP